MAEHTLFEFPSALKTCKYCKEEKRLEEFSKGHGKCKKCHSKANAKYKRSAAYSQAWRAKNKEKVKEYYRKYGPKYWASLSPEQKSIISARNKKNHFRRKYGLTQEDWGRLSAAQGGVCALCRIPGRTGKHGILHVDHCHATGRIRGLLCGACNVSLGILGDSPERLERVLQYVRGEIIKV